MVLLLSLSKPKALLPSRPGRGSAVAMGHGPWPVSRAFSAVVQLHRSWSDGFGDEAGAKMHLLP
jgi:hypothetical protein